MKDIERLYSDKALIVVNKPADLLSVPGRGPDKRDSVIWRVQKQFPTARVVHRLDCATSGLMIMALTADAQSHISKQFQERKVYKEYVACVDGTLKPQRGEVDLPLITDWPNRPRQKVDSEGKSALTHYEVIAHEQLAKEAHTRVLLKPVTGRSHQLRVHMMELGHPILGDSLYAQGSAKDRSDRLLLHARKLVFTHPHHGEAMEFHVDEPF